MPSRADSCHEPVQSIHPSKKKNLLARRKEWEITPTSDSFKEKWRRRNRKRMQEEKVGERDEETWSLGSQRKKLQYTAAFSYFLLNYAIYGNALKPESTHFNRL